MVENGSSDPNKISSNEEVQEPPPWGLSQAGMGLVVAFVASAASSQIWSALSGERLSFSGPLPLSFLVANLAGLWLGLLGAVIYSSTKARSNPVKEFGFKIRPWTDIPVGIGIGLSFQFVVIPVLYLPLRGIIPGLNRSLSLPARHLASGVAGPFENAVLGLLLVVGAPVVEELFFRGLLLRALERRFGSLSWPLWRFAPVVISAVVFGLVHAELLQLLGLVALGLVLGWVAQSTRRLGATVIAHATFNAAAFVVISALH